MEARLEICGISAAANRVSRRCRVNRTEPVWLTVNLRTHSVKECMMRGTAKEYLVEDTSTQRGQSRLDIMRLFKFLHVNVEAKVSPERETDLNRTRKLCMELLDQFSQLP